MHGYAIEELIGKDVRIFAPPELWNPMTPEQIEEMKSFRGETVNIRKDKSIFNVNLMSDVVKNIAGHPIGIVTTCEDITNRKLAEEELKSFSKKIEAIINSSSDLIFLKDKDFRYLVVNEECRKSFNLPSEDIIGKTDFDLMPRETAEECKRGDDLALKSDSPVHTEEHVGGSWLHVVKQKVVDSEGNIIGIAAVIRDITERKQAEEELEKYRDHLEKLVEERTAELIKTNVSLQLEIIEHEQTEKALQDSEAHMSAIIKAFTGFIYICTHDYHIEFMNRQLIDRTGYNATGELCYKVMHGLDSICPWCVNGKVFRGETVKREVLSPKDNRWYYVINTPIYQADGAITSKLSLSLDIAELKRAEEALRETMVKLEDEKAKSQAIIAAIGDGISIQATDFMVIYQNQIHKDFVGDHIGEYCYKAYRNNDRVCEECHLAMSFNDGKIHIKEQSKTTDEGKRYYEITASPLKDSTGEIIAGIEVVRDITERKKQEEELSRASNLRSIGRLAIGIAHEINNPLANASLNLEIMKNRLIDNIMDREILQKLEAIERNIGRASTIAKELLQFSRQGESEFIPLDINNVITSALLLLEHKLNSITIHQSLPEISVTLGDPVKLEQVFINILNNSVEAMPHGGDIFISISHINNYVEVKISDTGVGISDDHISKVFDPFFTTKEVGAGTGLGLSICYGIINQHSGTIEVSSKVGKGTAVIIKLPITENLSGL